MTEALFQILWLCLYAYFVGQIGTIQKGVAKRLVTGGIALTALVTALLTQRFAAWSLPAGWLSGKSWQI